MATLTLDWSSIRPLNGSRAQGFEELCAQLARSEAPAGARFERKGTPDAGVECYAVLTDSSEWGWQSKYFDTFGDSQWAQLDDSVKTALEKHPKLVRYFVCVPLDRSDARIEGRRSAKDRWDEHVAKWSGWAAGRGMKIDFVYCGSSELLERLADPKHVGRLRFWFDVHGFDGAWFRARVDEAISTAGPRYTPELHIDLPIAATFETLGRTHQFLDSIKAHARPVRDKLRSLEVSEDPEDVQNGVSGTELHALVRRGIERLGALELTPVGVLPFAELLEIVTAAEKAADTLEAAIVKRERARAQDAPATKPPAQPSTTRPDQPNRLRERAYHVRALEAQLRSLRQVLEQATPVANGSLLIVSGEAGTGKTHLLCDVARARLAAGLPTVLLMGQQFISADDPWTQALNQLDLRHLSAEEFVGALEAAAQAAGHRAMLLIDAVNEGAGRRIWPTHMPAFLAHVQRSPWITVVLTVRASYEELVIPEQVRTEAPRIVHRGFAGREYDATRAFFIHYGLELPSTPLIGAEFSNPLFLKTVCRGLNARGERRVPRGFHGLTAIFELFLAVVNVRLARELGYNPKTPLVIRAVEEFAAELVKAGERWLPLSQAEHLVNSFLPGREFERSLYRGLVAEGVLTEEATWREDAPREEVVFIAYDRFGDHLVASVLLKPYSRPEDVEAALANGAALAFLKTPDADVSPGLLEALFVQTPEKFGRELIALAPEIGERWGASEAFRRSLAWRSPAAFFAETRTLLGQVSGEDLDDTLDVLLTVASVPEHPLNANFLDARLRRDSMPDRDAWWSTYLHRARGREGAVDRLSDWAASVDPADVLEDEAVDLAALALSWMLSTPNRYVRDRATQALVSMLTGRLEAVGRLVVRMADVDDPYVRQRVLAVAYGTSMRSRDREQVARLAATVFAMIFGRGTPPPDILLRDYARGVVERSRYLGAKLDVDEGKVKPPYGSAWPHIPTEEEVQPFLADWSKGSHDSGELDWARNMIASSVMKSGDFARYVIGTNSSSLSSDWLSLRLTEPPWAPPPKPTDLLKALIAEFSSSEAHAWHALRDAERVCSESTQAYIVHWLDELEKGSEGTGLPDLETITEQLAEARPAGVKELERQREAARDQFRAVATEEHWRRYCAIIAGAEAGYAARQPPRLDLTQIQRYILKRVFELGWTIERFGRFDRFEVRADGREASKPERMGKKYQWIAYHEIMACVADNFQYGDRFREEHGAERYDGAWQSHLRDIDPSCTLRSLPSEAAWEGHSAAWWSPPPYDEWDEPPGEREWVTRVDDLPSLDAMLVAPTSRDGARWVNLQSYFHWKQRAPADRDPIELDRREVWFICAAYIVRSQDAAAFLKWAETVDFYGRWMPDPPEIYRMYLGEQGWSPASRYFDQAYYGTSGWTRPSRECPVDVLVTAREYLREARGFDCSIDEGYRLTLPSSTLMGLLDAQWSGVGADFTDRDGRLVACDPRAHCDGPPALLVREDVLAASLARQELSLCWTILGEKSVLPAEYDRVRHPELRVSGACVLQNARLVGFTKYALLDPALQVEPRVLHFIRLP